MVKSNMKFLFFLIFKIFFLISQYFHGSKGKCLVFNCSKKWIFLFLTIEKMKICVVTKKYKKKIALKNKKNYFLRIYFNYFHLFLGIFLKIIKQI